MSLAYDKIECESSCRSYWVISGSSCLQTLFKPLASGESGFFLLLQARISRPSTGGLLQTVQACSDRAYIQRTGTGYRKCCRQLTFWLKLYFHHNHRRISTKICSEWATGPGQADRRRHIKAQYTETWPQVCADSSFLPGWFWRQLWLEREVAEIVFMFSKESRKQEFDQECKQQFPLDEGEYYSKIVQVERHCKS